MAEFNGMPATPHSFDLLDGLLDVQVYRLAHWKPRPMKSTTAASSTSTTWRPFPRKTRSLRHDPPPAVRNASPRRASGVRIDHIDGLYDPTEYLWKLQHRGCAGLGAEEHLQGRVAPANRSDVRPAGRPMSLRELGRMSLPR